MACFVVAASIQIFPPPSSIVTGISIEEEKL